jgi:hypothetical protein
LQAFLLCDRIEELAVNLLFEHQGDDQRGFGVYVCDCGGLSSIKETKSTNNGFISRTSRTGQIRKKENHSLGATLFDLELAKEDFREGGA